MPGAKQHSKIISELPLKFLKQFHKHYQIWSSEDPVIEDVATSTLHVSKQRFHKVSWTVQGHMTRT